MIDLDKALTEAHQSGDKAALVALYRNAADSSDNQDDRAFFLTHAYIFALEIGDPASQHLKSQLALLGRETP